MLSRSFWRRCALALAVGTTFGILASAFAGSASAPAAPPRVSSALPTGLVEGFAQEVVASGLNLPTTFVHLPDGRILIAEKHGVVRLYRDGALQPTPFLDLSDRVNDFHDRGLLGMAADPDFASNGYVYLLYTYENDATQPGGTKTGRLARYTAVGDSASPSSELVVLGTLVGASCQSFPAGADCIPSDGESHTVGDLEFAPDGTLFVSVGDASRFDTVDPDALRAQSLDSLAGKVLHITRTGQGVPSNPFWNGDAGANRSKIWAYGLRNPYRFGLRPGTSTVYLGDVGWNQWEELNVATPGANLGWPCYEGPGRQPGYEPLPSCQFLYARGPSAVKPPLHYWDHELGHAATGGLFYTGTAFPESYRGAYFFGDFVPGWLATLRVDASDQLIPDSFQFFMTDAEGPADLEQGPDGHLYYVSLFSGELRRIRYVGTNRPPRAVATANPSEGYPPLSVQFSSAGSVDPDGDALQYTWDFGDGSPPSNLASPQHSYASVGLFTARLTVSDGNGGSHSATVPISVGNFAPVPTILSPSETFRFRVGDVVSYTGSATDAEDGAIPSGRLSWTVTLHHCTFGGCHSHPYSSGTGASGSFTVSDHGDEIFYELTLTATDSGGLQRSVSRTVHPQTVQLTLESSPPGRQVVLDGTSGPAPLTRTVIVGSSHTVYAPSPQSGYFFQSWSDNGAQQHAVTAGTTSATYTANFTATSCPTGLWRAEYFNNLELSGPPVLVRCEEGPISHDWGAESPAPEVNADQFSVRWTGQFYFPASAQTFAVTSDDGVRLYVDGDLLIDAWWDQSATPYEATVPVSLGHHTVVMEYYENAFDAVARLDWRQQPCPEGQFQAEYFNNQELSWPPVLVRCEAAPFSYNWGLGSPAPEVSLEHFSVRWTGRFRFSLGRYLFTATADDGVRVAVDGELLIDAWRDQGPTTYRSGRWLSPGAHTVTMEYYEAQGGAVAALRWARWF